MIETAEIVPMGQSDNEVHLYTLKEVAERIGSSYEKLRTYADVPGLKEYLGAMRIKGSKGVGYPESAIEIFARIMTDAEAGRVQPKTLSGYLEGLKREESGANGSLSLLPVNPSNVSLALLPTEQVALLESYVDALRSHSQALRCLPPPEDTLLSMKEASQQYGVSMAALRGMRVKEGARFKVRRSDVLRYIERLK